MVDKVNNKSSVVETFRQAYVVMKNEIKKYFSGKRMLLFLVLLVIVLAILTSAPYLVGIDEFTEGQMLTMYLSMAPLIVLMAATLFASITIVSEYEERTALIVFTRPISKGSIFLGKLTASLIVSIAFVALYYVYAAIMLQAYFGNIDSGVPTSFGLSCAYAVGCIGVAMFISSFMKKSNTATILTFVALMILITAASMVLSIAGMDVSWMIDQASGSIATCSPGYRAYSDEQIQQLAMVLMSPDMFIDFELYSEALIAYISPLIGGSLPVGVADQFPIVLQGTLLQSGAWNLGEIGELFGSMSTPIPDVMKDAFVMIGWGIVSLVASFVLFLRREF